MRSEKEMYDLILGYANADENIRAVILNGSRANPNRKPDPFNDFDIVYLVRDLTPCKEKAYYKDFGEILVCERTDESELFKEHFPEFVCYLMQFADGNRIDLTVSSIDRWEGYCYDDHLSVVLLDKDNALPKLPEPNESTHYVKKPTERMFFDCRTEFWWVSPYVLVDASLCGQGPVARPAPVCADAHGKLYSQNAAANDEMVRRNAAWV